MQEQQSEKFTYIRIHLSKRALDEKAREVLSFLGVECLDEGGEFEAYGIVNERSSVFDLIQKVPGIERIDVEAPPSGK